MEVRSFDSTTLLYKPSYRPKAMMPGVIPEAIEAVKNSKMMELNMSVDEKFLSSGFQVRLIYFLFIFIT
jgi:hypothetical protein